MIGALIFILVIAASAAFAFYYRRYKLREEWILFAALGKELGIPLKDTPADKLFPGNAWLYGKFKERFILVRIVAFPFTYHNSHRDTSPRYCTEIRLTAERKLPFEISLLSPHEVEFKRQSDIFISDSFATDFIIETRQKEYALRFLDDETVRMLSHLALRNFFLFSFDGQHLQLLREGAPESQTDIQRISLAIRQLLTLEERLNEAIPSGQAR